MVKINEIQEKLHLFETNLEAQLKWYRQNLDIVERMMTNCSRISELLLSRKKNQKDIQIKEELIKINDWLSSKFYQEKENIEILSDSLKEVHKMYNFDIMDLKIAEIDEKLADWSLPIQEQIFQEFREEIKNMRVSKYFIDSDKLEIVFWMENGQLKPFLSQFPLRIRDESGKYTLYTILNELGKYSFSLHDVLKDLQDGNYQINLVIRDLNNAELKSWKNYRIELPKDKDWMFYSNKKYKKIEKALL